MAVRAPIENRMVRCAIYTRKSTDRGLEKEVNSLATQRGVCEAYIKCQSHRNWVEVPHRYDDGGYSGGSLERPALRQMLTDIEAGRIDVVVLYKIDRLSRSLTDFVRLMDVLDKYGASFVSVKQTFDTSDSMGRLVLNILLTFAQFERELMSDRVRDKKAAMRRKGLFTGGIPPVGYRRGKSGKLLVDPEWGPIVREIFERFPDLSARQLSLDLQSRGIVSRRYKTRDGNMYGGQRIWPRTILSIIANPIYAGFFFHRDEFVKAEVEPLVTREQWDLVQEIAKTRYPQARDPVANFLLGILHDETGRRMKIQAAGIGRSRTYRYYRSEHAGWAKGTEFRRVMVEAGRVESLAKATLEALLADRIQLKQAVLSLGLYSSETARLLRRGQLSARRLQLMDPVQTRELFLALVPRAEVTRADLKLLVSCFELSRFLAWDGNGIFRRSPLRPTKGGDRFRMLYAPAFLICGHPYFALPVHPCAEEGETRNEGLISLIEEAAELRSFMLANRKLSVGQLAQQRRMGPSTFARMLRVNYLAPDIQAAIFDGTQPPTLTRRDILFGSLPLDWAQQRRLLGF